MFDSLKAILFDFDGTLIRQSIDFDFMRQVVLGIARRHGVVAEAFGYMPVLEILDRVREELVSRDGNQGQALLEEAHRAVVEIELAAAEKARAFPGVPEMLDRLHASGFQVGIVTRNCRVAVERVLERVPMHHDVLLTRDDVAQVKPDPRHLLSALEALDAAPAQAVMVGDHPMDVLAGRRIGAKTVGVLPPGMTAERFAGAEPDLLLTRVTDLLDHLGSVP